MIYIIKVLRAIVFIPIMFTFLLLGVDRLLESAELYFGGENK